MTSYGVCSEAAAVIASSLGPPTALGKSDMHSYLGMQIRFGRVGVGKFQNGRSRCHYGQGH